MRAWGILMVGVLTAALALVAAAQWSNSRAQRELDAELDRMRTDAASYETIVQELVARRPTGSPFEPWLASLSEAVAKPAGLSGSPEAEAVFDNLRVELRGGPLVLRIPAVDGVEELAQLNENWDLVPVSQFQERLLAVAESERDLTALMDSVRLAYALSTGRAVDVTTALDVFEGAIDGYLGYWDRKMVSVTDASELDEWLRLVEGFDGLLALRTAWLLEPGLDPDLFDSIVEGPMREHTSTIGVAIGAHYRAALATLRGSNAVTRSVALYDRPADLKIEVERALAEVAGASAYTLSMHGEIDDYLEQIIVLKGKVDLALKHGRSPAVASK